MIKNKDNYAEQGKTKLQSEPNNVCAVFAAIGFLIFCLCAIGYAFAKIFL
jgi:hypothetical protein